MLQRAMGQNCRGQLTNPQPRKRIHASLGYDCHQGVRALFCLRLLHEMLAEKSHVSLSIGKGGAIMKNHR